MAAIPSKHEYDDEDTQPYEYGSDSKLPPKVDRYLRHEQFLRDTRDYAMYMNGDLNLDTATAHALYLRVNGIAPLEYEPESEERATEYAVVGWQALKRTVARWLRRQADAIYEEVANVP